MNKHELEREWDNLVWDIHIYARDYYRYMCSVSAQETDDIIENDTNCVGQSITIIINRIEEIKKMYNEVRK